MWYDDMICISENGGLTTTRNYHFNSDSSWISLGLRMHIFRYNRTIVGWLSQTKKVWLPVNHNQMAG